MSPMLSIFLTILLPFAFAINNNHIVVFDPIRVENEDIFSIVKSKQLTRRFFEYENLYNGPVKFFLSEKSFRMVSPYIKYILPSLENSKVNDNFNDKFDFSWDFYTDTNIILFNTGDVTYKIKVKDTETNSFCLKIKTGEIEKELTDVQEIIIKYIEAHELNVEKKETSYNLRVDPLFEKFTIIFSDQQKSEIKSGENGKDDISIIFQNPENIEIKSKKK